MPPRLLRAAALSAALAALVATGAGADDYNVGSLAPPFLQSRTRMSVLERDDKVDAACKEKQFVKAEPVRAPELRTAGGIRERTWREIWTVTRCGTNVYYMIFFTEEGSGGASYGIVGPDARAAIEAYKDAQPAAVAPSKDFLVYFDSGKASLGADATRALEAAATTALGRGVPSVILTGHTDTVGGAGYNMKLSEQRAAAVKNDLVRRGIPVVDITTVGKGKTDLRVSTPDQVRERENRNVHIEIK